jgi:hypothetical protein
MDAAYSLTVRLLLSNVGRDLVWYARMAGNVEGSGVVNYDAGTSE